MEHVLICSLALLANYKQSGHNGHVVGNVNLSLYTISRALRHEGVYGVDA
jgi:hypothetical protein